MLQLLSNPTHAAPTQIPLGKNAQFVGAIAKRLCPHIISGNAKLLHSSSWIQSNELLRSTIFGIKNLFSKKENQGNTEGYSQEQWYQGCHNATTFVQWSPAPLKGRGKAAARSPGLHPWGIWRCEYFATYQSFCQGLEGGEPWGAPHSTCRTPQVLERVKVTIMFKMLSHIHPWHMRVL